MIDDRAAVEDPMTVTREDLFSIAMFPYLKTSREVRLGPYQFRATDDLKGLADTQAAAVAEVAAMLYAQNDVRIRSGSYAVIPQIHTLGVMQVPEVLKRIHSLVTYLYGTPHQQFGDPFLKAECATLLVLTPARVTRFLVEPEHHTILDNPLPIEWNDHHAPGYDGLLDLTEPFWVVKGSRIYPPVQSIPLNISQDLAADCNQYIEYGSGLDLLRLLTDDGRRIGDKVFTALSWYNASNRTRMSESEALVDLAIAFESLLDLPIGEKTDRFVDSVSLLLGRVPRLKDWVQQFYDARSRVAHEGKLTRRHFTIPQQGKPSQHLIYHPLLVFGREIFRLCVAAITHGAALAEARDIAAKLQTNSERFQVLCRIFDMGPMSDAKLAAEIRRIVGEINRYRFVGESGLSVSVILSALQRAVKSLLDSCQPLQQLDLDTLSRFVATSAKEELKALEVLMELHSNPPGAPFEDGRDMELTVWHLVDISWMYTFQTYFRLKQTAETKNRTAASVE
jgi:hypothetical protein